MIKEVATIILALLILIGFVSLLIMDRNPYKVWQEVICNWLHSSVKEVWKNHLRLTAW